MKTEVLTVDSADIAPAAIRRAAEVIRAGGLVAFPTETVYGLGANALDPAAVRRIFAAKGRPATNPLIVHVADADQVPAVAVEWPATAAKLVARFWPGPLTLVVPKGPAVPDIVTAGGATVAVRCPDHPIARALIREAGVPLAAPSANRSTELSPTRAEHVLKGLDGRIDLVLDGGPCPGGIESTVADATGEVVRVLRPGLVTVPMLEEVVGVGGVETSRKPERPEDVARSPGQMTKHYAPRTPAVLVVGQIEAAELLRRYKREGKRARALIWDTYLIDVWMPELVAMPDDPIAFAAALYDTLHRLDAEQLDAIIIPILGYEDEPEWAAVRDRLIRAAGKESEGEGCQLVGD